MSRCEILLQELRETDRIFEICVDLCFVRRLGVLTIVLHSSCSGASCLGRRVMRRASVFDEECMACVSSTVIMRTSPLESKVFCVTWMIFRYLSPTSKHIFPHTITSMIPTGFVCSRHVYSSLMYSLYILSSRSTHLLADMSATKCSIVNHGKRFYGCLCRRSGIYLATSTPHGVWMSLYSSHPYIWGQQGMPCLFKEFHESPTH